MHWLEAHELASNAVQLACQRDASCSLVMSICMPQTALQAKWAVNSCAVLKCKPGLLAGGRQEQAEHEVASDISLLNPSQCAPAPVDQPLLALTDLL